MRDLEQLKKISQEKVNIYFSNIEILEYINSQKARLFCYKCSYDWYGNLHNTIYKHRGCPVCSNQKIISGINSLWDTHPHIAKHLKNPKEGYQISYGSGKKLIWLCPSCGNETKPLQVCQITKYGIACHKCSDNISLPNKYMFNLLSVFLGNDFDYEVVFDWCKFQIKDKEFSGRYDFLFNLNNNKYIVEMDGGLGHGNKFSYDKIQNGINYKSPELSLEIDKHKDKLAIENGYHVIRIDCSTSTFEYITENVKNSILSELFDLETIDYIDLFERCMTSRIFEAIYLWENEVKNTKEIARIMRTSPQTIISYLKKGAVIGKCSYTPEEAIRISKSNHTNICRAKLGTKVICLTTGEIFNSYKDVKEKYSIKTFQFKKGVTTLNVGRHPITNEILTWQKYDDYIKIA